MSEEYKDIIKLDQLKTFKDLLDDTFISKKKEENYDTAYDFADTHKGSLNFKQGEESVGTFDGTTDLDIQLGATIKNEEGEDVVKPLDEVITKLFDEKQDNLDTTPRGQTEEREKYQEKLKNFAINIFGNSDTANSLNAKRVEWTTDWDDVREDGFYAGLQSPNHPTTGAEAKYHRPTDSYNSGFLIVSSCLQPSADGTQIFKFVFQIFFNSYGIWIRRDKSYYTTDMVFKRDTGFTNWVKCTTFNTTTSVGSTDTPVYIDKNSVVTGSTDTSTATNYKPVTKIKVSVGGTGLNTIKKGSYLIGNDTNAIQVKTPDEVLVDINAQEKLTFDTLPTEGSTNPVTSNGIKSYVDTMVSGQAKFVDALPTIGEENIVYYVPQANADNTDTIYDEYIWCDNSFIKVGDKSLNLNDYVSTQRFEETEEMMSRSVDQLRMVTQETSEAIDETKEMVDSNMTDTIEQGFYICDSNQNVAMKYDEEGLDFAKISNHAIEVLKESSLTKEECLSKSHQYVGQRVMLDKKYTFNSNYVMKLKSGGQATTTYGDYIFQGFAGGKCSIFDLKNKNTTPLATINLEPIGTSEEHHNNSLMFMDGVFYELGDEFPLLISQGSNASLSSPCSFVYRITRNGDSWNATLVSTIYVDQTDFESHNLEKTETAYTCTYCKEYNKLVVCSLQHRSTNTSTIATNKFITTLYDMPNFKNNENVTLNWSNAYNQFTTLHNRWLGMQAQLCVGDYFIRSVGYGTESAPNMLEFYSLKMNTRVSLVPLNDVTRYEMEGIMYSDEYGLMIVDSNGDCYKLEF